MSMKAEFVFSVPFTDLSVVAIQKDCSASCGHWLSPLIRGKTVLSSPLSLQVILSSPVSESHLNKF